MSLHMDSWPWKIALVLALVGMREFVRLLGPKAAAGRAGENSRWLIETLDSGAIAIGLVLFVIQPFLLQAFWIPTGSMEDTLRPNDRVLASKLIYHFREPRFQDVVVFRAPPRAQPEPGAQEDFIKRCMGAPGDTVYVKNRVVYHNGRKVAEPYTKWNPSPTEKVAYDMKVVDGVIYSRDYDAPDVPGLWVSSVDGIAVSSSVQENIERAPAGGVPAGKFLMLGDHRNASFDSHYWGFVPRANIVGKAVCVFWPPTRVGLVDRMSFHPALPSSAQQLPLQP